MRIGSLSYKKLCEKINAQLDSRDHISIRTLRFWVKEGLISPPEGKGKNRLFPIYSIGEGIAVRKLQVDLEQSNNDIRELDCLLRSEKLKTSALPLYDLVTALSKEKHVKFALEAFKIGELILVKDEAYGESYKLIPKHADRSLYVKDSGRIFKLIENVKNERGEFLYFDIENIEDCFIQEPLLSKSLKFKDIVERVKLYAQEGVLPKPCFRHKGKDYYSQSNLFVGTLLRRLENSYGLSLHDLKKLKKKIEDDIKDHFHVLKKKNEISLPLYREFYKQAELFENIITFLHHRLFFCEKQLKDHTENTSRKILQDYLNGFWFLCRDSFFNYGLKPTPLSRLTPQQIKQGLKEGRFTKKEVEKVFKAKASEVEALRKIIF